MRKQWIIVAAIVALLSAGAYLGLKLSPDIFPVEAGSRAPEFSAIDITTGDTVSLSQYRGQVVMINVWATWCEPCKVEMPSIEHLHQELGPQGLKILAVSIDNADDAVVRKYQRDYGLTFRILHDRAGAIERKYQTTGYPESFVLNRDGQIVKKVIGAAQWDAPVNRDLFKRLLAQHG